MRCDEPLRLAGDDAGVLAAHRLALVLPGRQQLAEHADERQRRLELVRDVGDEVALAAATPRRSARTDSQSTPRPTAMITSDTGTSSTPSRRSVSACLRSSSTSLGVIWMRQA